MPKITGWQFLDAFELFDPSLKERLNIYVLSSSIDRRDKDRAARNKNVLDYIEKPLSTSILEKLLSRFSF
jgi:response regulator RpfG family c-di-GMP phosphodiesterase